MSQKDADNRFPLVCLQEWKVQAKLWRAVVSNILPRITDMRTDREGKNDAIKHT